MGTANVVTDNLMARPPSTKELQARQAAMKPRRKLVATLNGQLVEKAPTAREKPRVVVSAPKQTWD